MAMLHLQPGEKISLQPVPADQQRPLSVALFKSQHLEVVHFVMRPGQQLPEHRVPGEVTIQCLSGCMVVRHGESARLTELAAQDLLFLAGDDVHAVHAPEHCTFLVTMALVPTHAGQVPDN